jgi:hypothetical protein
MKPTTVRPVGRVMARRELGSVTISVPPRRTQASMGGICVSTSLSASRRAVVVEASGVAGPTVTSTPSARRVSTRALAPSGAEDLGSSGSPPVSGAPPM